MNASRMKPETHWKSVGAAVSKRGGSIADLDKVKTGKQSIDAWIIAGYEKANRIEASKAIKLASTEHAVWCASRSCFWIAGGCNCRTP